MNLRERVLAVLNGKKPDMVPWLGDLDYWMTYLRDSGKMPDIYRGNGIYELHRNLGVGFYLQGYFPFKNHYENVLISTYNNQDIRTTKVETPVGLVEQIEIYLPQSYTWAIREHFVKDVKDLKVIRYWYEHTNYEPDYKLAKERYELVGDNGLVLCYLPKSPLMEMVALLSGIEAATFALLDDPDEFNETMEVLGYKADEAAQIALDSPAECLMIPENLSSEVIGKNLFESYMRSYEERWNRKIKEAGKYSFVHMDGTMRGLIKEVSSTGFTVMEALTPSPVGDIPVEDMHKWVGEDTIIWGGIPGLYFTDLISDEVFDRFVAGTLEVMKTKPRYVLGVADQVPPGARMERIKRVSELVAAYGIY